MYIGALEPVTNREDWTIDGELTDESGVAVDITTADITMGVRDQKTKSQVLTAEVGDGITILVGPSGTFEIAFLASQMRALCAGTYDVGIIIEIATDTTQLFTGTVRIIDGVVT